MEATQPKAINEGIGRAHSRSRFRRGFSFTEILFAVMILGIGFIMIAAIFPVAIKQTAATGEETVAATTAKAAVNTLQNYANSTIMPPTTLPASPTVGQLVAAAPIAGTNTSKVLWDAISGNLILPSDPRYAWAAFYKRDSGANYAQVIVIGLQVRNASIYTAADLTPVLTPSPLANLQPRPLNAVFKFNAGSPDIVTLSDSGSGFKETAVEGAFVVVSADPGSSTNGYVYRLGVARPDVLPYTFELLPGNDTTGANVKPPASPTFVPVFVIGRGFENPTVQTFSGLAQDVAVYTSFVRISN